MAPATITNVTFLNKIYTIGVDRTFIAVIDSTTKTQIGTIPLPGPADVVCNSATNKLYLGQYHDNKVSVMDVATDTIIPTLTIGAFGNGANASAYHPTNHQVYITNTGGQTVAILGAAFDSALEAPIPVTPGVTTAAFDATANRPQLSTNFLVVIDGVTV